MTVDKDYGLMSIGAAASSALDLMEEELREAQKNEDTRAFKLMAENRLSGEEAQMAFARKFSLYQMHVRLLAKVVQGRNAAERIRKADNG